MTVQYRSDAAGATTSGQSAVPVIVYSDVRWNGAAARAQQVAERLADRHPVLFVEAPRLLEGGARAWLEVTHPHPRIVRVVPHIGPDRLAGGRAPWAIVRGLLRLALAKGGALEGRFDRPVQWFFDAASAVAMAGAFEEAGVIYDRSTLSRGHHAPSHPLSPAGLATDADVSFTVGLEPVVAQGCERWDRTGARLDRSTADRGTLGPAA